MLLGDKKELAQALMDIGAVKFGRFRLKLHEKDPSAPLSPIYIDLCIIRSFPAHYKALTSVYLSLLNGLRFDYLADVPTAATFIVALLALETRKPMVSPRLDAKSHGLTNSVDGLCEPGKTAVLVDDLITRAESKLEAIQVLKDNGLEVRDIVVLIDREQGGAHALEERGYRCHAGYRLTELVSFYAENHMISREQEEQVLSYLRSTAR